jgi:hypothetical protein
MSLWFLKAFDESTAQNAVTWVTRDRQVQKLEADLTKVYGLNLEQVNKDIENMENPVWAEVIKNADKEISNNDARRAAPALERYIELNDLNSQMKATYTKELEQLTGVSGRKIDFEAAIDRINSTTVFELEAPMFDSGGNVSIPNPSQAGSMDAGRVNWGTYTPFTTYLDTGRRAWLGS